MAYAGLARARACLGARSIFAAASHAPPRRLHPASCALQIWDTAGQERFRTITTSYFRGAQGIVLVYDVTDRDSFENVRTWMQEISKNADKHANVMLVGNKCDMEDQRKVSKEEGEALAREQKIPFVETSAKSDINVTECFYTIAKSVKERLDAQAATAAPASDSVKVAGGKSGKKDGCC